MTGRSEARAARLPGLASGMQARCAPGCPPLLLSAAKTAAVRVLSCTIVYKLFWKLLR